MLAGMRVTGSGQTEMLSTQEACLQGLGHRVGQRLEPNNQDSSEMVDVHLLRNERFVDAAPAAGPCAVL